ncbi:hypothetical protein MesoLjLc_50870 [Mesorhizobium sp. L-8-10]|uniref:hypothetical protein n=1 Tax=Mesorhizobium sp. L-8-10 TaxID=2744523 RepID=UPI00192865D6|nr:hypothetical protein [Mesorhizobium sp. L-8-10]BCH33157.1 hypothetical protein MesoLjLc_50870 [Mesorhizobium sp. L-8-10]
MSDMTTTLHVPGVWRCPKCKFRLVQMGFNAADGTVFNSDKPGEKCPNCSSPLWRVSWEDEAKEILDIAEAAILRERQLRDLVDELKRIVDAADAGPQRHCRKAYEFTQSQIDRLKERIKQVET